MSNDPNEHTNDTHLVDNTDTPQPTPAHGLRVVMTRVHEGDVTADVLGQVAHDERATACCAAKATWARDPREASLGVVRAYVLRCDACGAAQPFGPAKEDGANAAAVRRELVAAHCAATIGYLGVYHSSPDPAVCDGCQAQDLACDIRTHEYLQGEKVVARPMAMTRKVTAPLGDVLQMLGYAHHQTARGVQIEKAGVPVFVGDATHTLVWLHQEGDIRLNAAAIKRLPVHLRQILAAS